MDTNKKRNFNYYVLAFFIIFLLIGIFIFPDYGISNDETRQRELGMNAFNYVFYHNQTFLSDQDKDYGVAFELPAYSIEKILNLTDSKDIYLTRHLLNFLVFFLGVFFFYLLCKDYFKDWRLGLLGALFLILSPRIFANSFYNSKDLVFMSLLIIGIYSLIKWLEKKSVLRTFMLALASAITIDIRIMGIILPALAFLLFFLELIFEHKDKKIKKELFSILLFIIFLIFFVILFSPYLYTNPINNFISAFRNMSQFNRWNGINLFFGYHFSGNNLPWYYIPLWILITTPILYSIGFVIGTLMLIIQFFKNQWKNYSNQQKKANFIFLLWFFLPLFAILFFHSTLYNSWRQMFFIYPAFLIISIIGLSIIFDFIENLNKKKLIKTIAITLILLSLSYTAAFMIYFHPHQDVYFNALAGKPSTIRNNFELDYWGLSYRQGLEYILKTDNRSTIKIYKENTAVERNSYILPSDERKRLQFVLGLEKNPDYFLTNYYMHEKDYPYNEAYSIKVNGIKIMTIYKLR